MPDPEHKTEDEYTTADWIQRARDPHFRPRSIVADDPDPVETDPAKMTAEQHLQRLRERQ
jgi:hypothetical protein